MPAGAAMLDDDDDPPDDSDVDAVPAAAAASAGDDGDDLPPEDDEENAVQPAAKMAAGSAKAGASSKDSAQGKAAGMCGRCRAAVGSSLASCSAAAKSAVAGCAASAAGAGGAVIGVCSDPLGTLRSVKAAVAELGTELPEVDPARAPSVTALSQPDPPSAVVGNDGQVYHGRSLLCMRNTHVVRRKTIALVEAGWFSKAILLTILANCITMAWQSPLDPPGTPKAAFISVCEWVFLAIFTVELCTKVVAFGFVLHAHSYLRDPWCIIDFVVVTLAWIPIFIPSFGNYSSVRAIRALRPLRTVKRIPGMAALVTSLIQAGPKLGTVAGLCLFTFLVLVIAGMEFFKGSLHYRCIAFPPPPPPAPYPPPPQGCYDQPQTTMMINGAYATCATMVSYCESIVYGATIRRQCPVTCDACDPYPPPSPPYMRELIGDCNAPLDFVDPSMSVRSELRGGPEPPLIFCRPEDVGKMCPGGGTCVYMRDNPEDLPASFDSSGEAGIILMQIITGDVWTPTMYYLMDASFSWAWAYHLLVVIIGGLFMINLFLAVVFDEFMRTQELERLKAREFERRRQSVLSRESKVSLPDAADEAAAGGEEADALLGDGEHAVELSDGTEKPPIAAPKRRLCSRLFAPCTRFLRTYAGMPSLRPIVESNAFEALSFTNIVATMVVTSAPYAGMSAAYAATLVFSSTVISLLYIGEVAIKFLGLGAVSFWADGWNTFDTYLASISAFDLVFEAVAALFASGVDVNLVFLRVLRMLRLMRVARFLKVMRHWAPLHNAVSVIVSSWRQLTNILVLLLLIMAIFALLGMQIFGGACDSAESRWYFDYFGPAMITVLAIFSGVWVDPYESCMGDGGGYSVVFFLAALVLGNMVMLNLFIAVLFEGFAAHTQQQAEEAAAAFRKEAEGEEAEEAPAGERKPTPKPAIVTWGIWCWQRCRRLASLRRDNLHELSAEWLLKVSPEDAEDRHRLERRVSVVQARFRGNKTRRMSAVRDVKRMQALRIVNKPSFEFISVTLVIASAICLAIDSPRLDPCSALKGWLDTLSLFFALAFTIEAVLKILAYRYQFFASGWNLLDFFIVLVSLVALLPPFAHLATLRVLRTLRPLRLLSRLEGMKVIFSFFVHALRAVLQVAGIIIFCQFFFAVVGMELFMDSFGSCTDESITLRSLCGPADGSDPSRRWLNPKVGSFDNIFSANLLLYVSATGDGWEDVMYMGMDAVGPGIAPERNDTSIVSLYFICWMFVGSFCTFQLFVGTIVDIFQRVKSEVEGSSLLTPEQRQWQRTMQENVKDKPPEKRVRPPTGDGWLVRHVRRPLHSLVTSTGFDVGITAVVLSNVLLMSFDYHGIEADADFYAWYSNTQSAFAMIYYFECVAKIAGLGLGGYFGDNWCRFDFTLVCTSILDQLATAFGTTLLPVPPMLLRVLRVLRVLRILRMLKGQAFRGLRDLVFTLVLSIPALANVTSLLALVIFIYAILGVELFTWIIPGEALDSRRNFNNMGSASLVLLQALVGEWSEFMFDTIATPEQGCDPNGSPSGCGDAALSISYFVSYYAIGNLVMLNLIVAVILENFSALGDVDPTLVSSTDIALFGELWADIDPDANGKASLPEVNQLLLLLPPPLGLSEADRRRWPQPDPETGLVDGCDAEESHAAIAGALSEYHDGKGSRIVADDDGEVDFLIVLNSVVYRSFNGQGVEPPSSMVAPAAEPPPSPKKMEEARDPQESKILQLLGGGTGDQPEPPPGRPPELPDGWATATTPRNSTPYYFHRTTQQVSWLPPVDMYGEDGPFSPGMGSPGPKPTERCAKCDRGIKASEERATFQGKTFHAACMRCSVCNVKLHAASVCADSSGALFCKPHLVRALASKPGEGGSSAATQARAAVAAADEALQLQTSRITVVLRRGEGGALGLGIDDDNRISALGPDSPALKCGLLRIKDKVVSVSGQPIEPGQDAASLLPKELDARIQFTVVRTYARGEKPPVTEMVTVELTRGEDGALGLGLDDNNRVSALGEGSPAAASKLQLKDKVVSVNDNQVEPGEDASAMVPKWSGVAGDPPIEFVVVRTLNAAQAAAKELAAKRKAAALLASPPTRRMTISVTRGPNGGLGLGLDSENRVSQLKEDGPAMAAGLRKTDRVVAVNGTKVEKGVDAATLLPKPAAEGEEEVPIELIVVRTLSQDEITTPIRVVLKRGLGKGGLGLGLDDENRISKLAASGPAAKCGQLKLGDKCCSVNGVPVRFGQAASDMFPTGRKPIALIFRRDLVEWQTISLQRSPEGRLGLGMDDDNRVSTLVAEGPAASSELKLKDQVVLVNGTPVAAGTSASDMFPKWTPHAPTGDKPIELVVVRALGVPPTPPPPPPKPSKFRKASPTPRTPKTPKEPKPPKPPKEPKPPKTPKTPKSPKSPSPGRGRLLGRKGKAAAEPPAEPKKERVSISLERAENGSLGLGINKENVVSKLTEGSPAGESELRINDKVVAVNGADVDPGVDAATLMPKWSGKPGDAPIELLVEREVDGGAGVGS